MNYINNWLYELSAGFAPGAAELPVPADALTRLQLAEGVVYTLSLSAELNADDPADTEIIRIVGAEDGGYSLERGLEGTAELDWPAGTKIFAGITAGMLAELAAGGSDTGWLGAPAAPGYTGELPQYRLINGVVYWRGIPFILAEDVNVAPIAILPAAARPSATFRQEIVSQQLQLQMGIQVEPNGQVTIVGLMDDGTGDWMPFDSVIFPAG